MKKLLTNKTTAEIKQVVAITFAWMLIGAGVSFYEYSLLSSPFVSSTNLTFTIIFISQMIATFSAGIIGGTVTVKFFQKWIRTKPYGKALLLIVLVFSLICILVSYIAGCSFFSNQLNQPIFSKEVQISIFEFLFGLEFLRIYFLWLTILLATNMALLVRDKYGPGVFQDFLLGRYFLPRREDRIFMFLDLRSSTTIAEELGEIKYFEFLKNVFSDVTPSILFCKGEIYQYVGDEIIISWKTDKGLENTNCINCFFDIKKELLDKSEFYRNQYGILPKFKAGLHYGHVMTGEIGVVKRDITFLGDVLNTAARIQDQCNEMGVDILFSEKLLDKLKLPAHIFSPKKMGDILLRGKQEKIVLFTV